MKREDIVKGLKDAGYNVEECVNVKNGVNFRGIRFAGENGLCPVIYTDEIIRQSGSVAEAVKKVLIAYNSAKDMVKDVKIDRTKIEDPDFILQNVHIGLQKESDEALVKKETVFEGIEQYLYVRIDERSSYKLFPQMVKARGMDQAKLWRAAEGNTYAETQIVPMAAITPGGMGLGSKDLYVVTNETGIRGASAVLDTAALERFAQKSEVHKFIVLPSSIHEMILVPNKEAYDLSGFNEMVKDINQMQVVPEERLTDRAYVLNVD